MDFNSDARTPFEMEKRLYLLVIIVNPQAHEMRPFPCNQYMHPQEEVGGRMRDRLEQIESISSFS